MHFATDPLEAQFNGETYLSRAKVSSTLGDRYKRQSGESKTNPEVKSRTLKQRITGAMPAWRKTVNNLANPTSAASKIMRATAAKGSPSKAAIKSYHY